MIAKCYKAAPGLLVILLFGLVVEGANFESTFFRFMTEYRPDWGKVNHLFAALLSAFLLMNIVEWGLRGNKELSWTFALITMIISFSVYARMELTWDFTELTEMHLVVLILSVMLPAVVAYTTHQIRQVTRHLEPKRKPAGERERSPVNEYPVPEDFSDKPRSDVDAFDVTSKEKSRKVKTIPLQFSMNGNGQHEKK